MKWITSVGNAIILPELYLITPQAIDIAKFKMLFEQLISEVPISCFQIRLPNANKEELKNIIKTLAPIAWKKDIAVLLCDQADLVVELDLDGLHLEIETHSKAVKAARKTIGEKRSLGVSCRSSKHMAMEAGESGADYISFGPLFPLPYKSVPADEDVKSILEWWAVMMELPCVASGGLTLDNIVTSFNTGAEFYAPISGIWNHPSGAVEAAKMFHSAACAYTEI